VPRLTLPEKLAPLLQPKRYKVLYGGRGSAKSWSVARALVHLATMRPLRILCARETQKSIQESVHRLIKDQIDALDVGHLFDVQETRILGKNGSDFAFAGVRQQGVANLKSFEAVDICWVEEAQVVTKRSWDVLIPTIRKPGSEIWITFNPELEDDETYARFVSKPPPEAWVCPVNWNDNPWFPGVLESERLLMKERDPTGYRTTWDGKCRHAVDGAIYAEEVAATLEAKRVRPVPRDPMLKVHTVWDLGNEQNMACLLVQRGGAEVRVVDYLTGLRSLPDYVAEFAQRKGWIWGEDWLPHDGETMSLQTGKSSKEILQGLGRTVRIVPKLGVEEGIKAARMLFPRVFFDEEKAAPLLASLKRYRRVRNETTGAYGTPLHDDHSHPADAFRYLAVIADQLSNEDWGTPLPPQNLGII
jgi:phage terminase large subunit